MKTLAVLLLILCLNVNLISRPIGPKPDRHDTETPYVVSGGGNVVYAESDDFMAGKGGFIRIR